MNVEWGNGVGMGSPIKGGVKRKNTSPKEGKEMGSHLD